MTTYFAPKIDTSTVPDLPGASWGQGRRLEFIDFRLRWDKTVNRSDLTAHFGISVPQASTDIARYTQLASHNLFYDRSSRTYRATDSYVPVVGNTAPQRYLNELLACEHGLLGEHDSYLGWMPAFATVPVLSRLVDAATLSMLLDAIREQTCVRINYQSDAAPEPVERVISPHALGFDGFRWHVRAFCLMRGGYRDFILGRILKISKETMLGRAPELDSKWLNVLSLFIGANPALSEGNRRAVELDYSMVDGKAVIEVRQALLYYVLKELGLGPFSPPRGAQIVLLNKAELSGYIQDAVDVKTPTKTAELARSR